jgi:hypothetical protein
MKKGRLSRQSLFMKHVIFQNTPSLRHVAANSTEPRKRSEVAYIAVLKALG